MLLMPSEDGVVNVLENEYLCCIGMQLFRAAGHTVQKKAVIQNKSIKDFVFFDIQHSQVLTTADWNALNKVILISLLFTNERNFFTGNKNDDEIDYFSISLCAAQIDRSISAYEVHRVLSRISISQYSVVLFEANGYYMLSFAERLRNRRNKVVLSDWHTKNDIIDKELFLNIDAAYFSSNSVREFFYDFEYAVARFYYIYPISYEYACYEMIPINLFEESSFDIVDRETIKEINRANYILPLLEYQDDYVSDEEDSDGMQEYSTDDIKLDLLEFELDLLQSNDEDEDDEEYCDSNISDYDEIDKEIFKDPISMLKWIEKHSFIRKK